MRFIAYIAVGLSLLIAVTSPADHPLPKTDTLCLIGAIEDCSK
jgi:hypothetical protein